MFDAVDTTVSLTVYRSDKFLLTLSVVLNYDLIYFGLEVCNYLKDACILI